MGRTVKIEEIKPGMRFSLSVMDGTVLMETSNVRVGDVWDCHPVVGASNDYCQQYGQHEVYTVDQLKERIERFRSYTPMPEWTAEPAAMGLLKDLLDRGVME